MKAIIGLGNPGEQYKNNRHNVGAMLVDRLQSTVYSNASWSVENKLDAAVCRLNALDVLLAKPQTFMNESGKAVKKIVDFYFGRNKVLRGSAGSYKIPMNNLYVVYDDLDIPLGSYKIVQGRGPRQHNGVESVKEALGTEDFWHVRIGIDNRKVEKSRKGVEAGREYVLQDFAEEEQRILEEIMGEITEKLGVKL